MRTKSSASLTMVAWSSPCPVLRRARSHLRLSPHLVQHRHAGEGLHRGRIDRQRLAELGLRPVELPAPQEHGAEIRVVKQRRDLSRRGAGRRQPGRPRLRAVARPDVAEGAQLGDHLVGGRILDWRRLPVAPRRRSRRFQALVGRDPDDGHAGAEIVAQGRLQHLSGHVLGRRETEQVQDRGRDVVEGDGGNLAPPDAGSGGDEDTVEVVPEPRLPLDERLDVLWPAGAAAEAVIGDHEDGPPAPGGVQDLADDGVLEAVERRQGVAEPPPVAVAAERQRGRRAVRETVIHFVHPLEVDGQKRQAVRAAPVARQDVERNAPVGLGGGQHPRQEVDRFLRFVVRPPRPVGGGVRPGLPELRLADARVARHLGVRDGLFRHLQPGHLGGVIRRVDRAPAALRPGDLERRVRHPVGHQPAPDRLRGPGGPPGDDRRLHPGLGEDRPQGLGAPEARVDRDPASGARVGHQEIVDSVSIRRLAGGHRGPQERGERGDVGPQAGPGALTAQAGQVRELAPGEHRIHEFPVGAVDADQQDSAAGVAAEAVDRVPRERRAHLGSQVGRPEGKKAHRPLPEACLQDPAACRLDAGRRLAGRQLVGGDRCRLAGDLPGDEGFEGRGPAAVTAIAVQRQQVVGARADPDREREADRAPFAGRGGGAAARLHLAVAIAMDALQQREPDVPARPQEIGGPAARP
jgi:hypothetical protein